MKWLVESRPDHVVRSDSRQVADGVTRQWVLSGQSRLDVGKGAQTRLEPYVLGGTLLPGLTWDQLAQVVGVDNPSLGNFGVGVVHTYDRCARCDFGAPSSPGPRGDSRNVTFGPDLNADPLQPLVHSIAFGIRSEFAIAVHIEEHDTDDEGGLGLKRRGRRRTFQEFCGRGGGRRKLEDRV